MKRRSTSPFAHGATVLTVWPPDTTPTLSVMPASDVGQRMQRQRLVREFVDRADADLEVRARMRRLAGDLEAHEHAALAAGDRRAGARPGSELNTTRAARACCSITLRENGEPISSSPVNNA